MPKVNVYLPDDLADSVRDLQLPLSVICQRALADEVSKRSRMAVGSGNLLDAGLPVKPPHRCQCPSVDTSRQPWKILGRPVGATAKWECADCKTTWMLGFDGKWNRDLTPLVGAVFDLLKAGARPRRTTRLQILRPPRETRPS